LEKSSSDDLAELKSAFLQHEAVCEERWKSMFHELRDYKDESRDRASEIDSSIKSLHRLLLTVSGALILFLAGVIASGAL
jgi:hypothetical protein